MQKVYTVTAKDGRFLMAAPLSTILEVFDCKLGFQGPSDRIQSQSGSPEGCTLHFNGRRKLGLDCVVVYSGMVI